MDIIEKTFPVPFDTIDQSDRLTISSVFGFFQDAAINHAESLGVGRERLAETGVAWILSRISVFVERRPKWKEMITVRSWPRSWEKLFACRDYDILDESGKPIIFGRSRWLIVDMGKRRPMRPQTFTETLPLNEGLDALPGGCASIENRECSAKAGERRAVYSDIDYNGHVNNVRYIQWIQDAADAEALVKADSIRLDMNYTSETRIGELTEFWTSPLDMAKGLPLQDSDNAASNSFIPRDCEYASYIEGQRPGTGQQVFRAELRLGK